MIVLITGMTGFIGSHLARHLIEEGHQVIGFDFLPTPARISDIAERVHLVKGDIGDLEVLLEAVRRYNVSHIVHLASYMPAAAIADHPL